jgi:dTDP-4-dehydrorhamnose reductase
MIVLGSTGMLGQAFMKTALDRNIGVIGLARENADLNIDILDFNKLINTIKIHRPKVIVNCIAITDINLCEDDLNMAYLVNAHLVAVLVDVCRELNIRLIHISTDHFFVNDGNKKHNETSPTVLVNNYAKTKYAGEQFALSYPKSLVIRTNIVGFRNSQSPTFIEWALSSLKNQKEITLFQDFYTSSIDVYTFSEILLQIIDESSDSINGLINIASSEVCNKEQFIKKLAIVFNYKNTKLNIGNVASINGTKRAESLGLDTSKIEQFLGKNMPTTDNVIDSLYKNWGK